MKIKKNTKELIKNKAVELFNLHGFSHVKIQQIAEALGISLGNLTYHFKTKEILIEQILNDQLELQKKFHDKFRLMPIFQDFDVFIENYFYFQDQYLFFFTDKLDILRNYPAITQKEAALRKWEEQLLFSFFQFNVARGSFVSEMISNSFYYLAKQVSWQLESWLMVQELRGIKTPNLIEFKKSIWLLLYPYFSDLGKMEWGQFENNKIFFTKY